MDCSQFISRITCLIIFFHQFFLLSLCCMKCCVVTDCFNLFSTIIHSIEGQPARTPGNRANLPLSAHKAAMCFAGSKLRVKKNISCLLMLQGGFCLCICSQRSVQSGRTTTDELLAQQMPRGECQINACVVMVLLQTMSTLQALSQLAKLSNTQSIMRKKNPTEHLILSQLIVLEPTQI